MGLLELIRGFAGGQDDAGFACNKDLKEVDANEDSEEVNIDEDPKVADADEEADHGYVDDFKIEDEDNNLDLVSKDLENDNNNKYDIL